MAVEIDRREAYRYLGLRGAAPDAATAAAVDEAVRLLDAVVEPRQVSRRFLLKRTDDGALDIEGLRVESRALLRNLEGCREVFLMAASLYMAISR